MLDFWKAIITTLVPHLLGWPVAAVVLGLIFKKQAAAFLARLKNLRAQHGSTSLNIETELGAAEQKIEQGNATAGALSPPTTAAIVPASTATLAVVNAAEPPVDEVARKAIIDFGKGIEAVQIRETEIRGHLKRLQFELNTPETTDILIRSANRHFPATIEPCTAFWST